MKIKLHLLRDALVRVGIPEHSTAMAGTAAFPLLLGQKKTLSADSNNLKYVLGTSDRCALLQLWLLFA